MEHAEPPDIKQVTESAVAQHPALPFDLLHIYLTHIIEWNERIGLVSRERTLATLGRLVTQSVRLWEMIGEAHSPIHRAVDIGTGAGFPGVIWKLLSPETEIILIDRRAKKATFLERTVAVMGIEGADVFEGEAEDAVRLSGMARGCDAAAAIAVGSPELTIPLAEPFLREGGVFATTTSSSESPPERLDGMQLAAMERVAGGPNLCIFRREE